jgi:cytochrome c553
VSTPLSHTDAMGVLRVGRAMKGKRSPHPGAMRKVLRLVLAIAALVSMAIPVAGRAAEVEAGRRKAEVCAPCHGADGNSTDPNIPSLAGQPRLFTYYQLLQFREGQRTDPQMSPVAAGLSDADMQELAAFYAAQTPVAPGQTTDPATVEAGQRLVQVHHCDSCHAPGLVGQNHIPRLAGQHYEYLVKQLRAYKAQTRTDLEGSMTMAAQPLSVEDIEILARYIAQLRPIP